MEMKYQLRGQCLAVILPSAPSRNFETILRLHHTFEQMQEVGEVRFSLEAWRL
ncbi:hypothetical protein D3C72_2585560 [compost metagenome]